MRICMVVNYMNKFGGMEEFTQHLAIGIQQQGHQVSVLSTIWVPPDNQYLSGLREKNVTYIQLSKWLSLLTTNWSIKEKILKVVMWLSSPVVILLAGLLALMRRRSWEQSYSSARNWLRGQWMSRVIGPDRRKPFVRLLLDWWRLRWRPDLIHIQGYTSELMFVIEWAHARRIPVIYEEHQTPDSQFDWWKDFRKTINKASTIIAVSQKSAQALRDVCSVTQPIVVAYYMVPDPADSGWTTKYDPPKGVESLQVTTNARLYVTKGLNYLLDAIVLVRKVHPSTQFKVYGDGPLRAELLEYARKLDLDGNQIFVGAYTSRNELSQIMVQTDIYVMSSILEGIPLALLEAMSYGRPIVVTPAGGIAEAIEDGVNGLLCKPKDPESLAQNICKLIQDPDLRVQLGRAARQSYEQGPFRPSAVCKQAISIYENVLKQSKACNQSLVP